MTNRCSMFLALQYLAKQGTLCKSVTHGYLDIGEQGLLTYSPTCLVRWEGLAQDGRKEKYGALVDGPARFPTAKQGEVEGEEWSPLVHRHCDPSVTYA